ncbi:NUP50 (Nucleoporin 50 kDa) protein [Rhynchospora pubera]|uniref:NUP50 (Nucleoporin 50 kDa) protein n=1 Tax=Rhynchospora pubera TaxID=906938 RepID=A0AAV8GMY2_9POAL|nr:NUP50 (Nucleoporin 50 kDa) protein [Rhynchospora pubera]
MADDEITSSRKRVADTEVYKDQRPDGVSFSDEPEVGPLRKKRVVDREINKDSGTSARVTEEEEDDGERKEVLAEEDMKEAEKSEVNVARENVEGENMEVTNKEKVKTTGEGENVEGEGKGVGGEMGDDGGDKRCGGEKENVGGEKEEGIVEGGRIGTDEKEDPKPAINFSSFQHLSSSQNAFSGLAGTGFSTTSFTFGSSTTSTSVFGAVPTNNGSSLSSLIGLNASPAETNKVTMHEVHVETGEENEKAVFTADAVLYEYLDGGWKERGKGELKLNLTTTGINKARLLMRARGNYRLILNASLYADIALKEMDKKRATFVCVNGTGEGQTGPSMFALKFKDEGSRDNFCASVEAHKAKTASRD